MRKLEAVAAGIGRDVVRVVHCVLKAREGVVCRACLFADQRQLAADHGRHLGLNWARDSFQPATGQTIVGAVQKVSRTGGGLGLNAHSTENVVARPSPPVLIESRRPLRPSDAERGIYRRADFTHDCSPNRLGSPLFRRGEEMRSAEAANAMGSRDIETW